MKKIIFAIYVFGTVAAHADTATPFCNVYEVETKPLKAYPVFPEKNKVYTVNTTVASINFRRNGDKIIVYTKDNALGELQYDGVTSGSEMEKYKFPNTGQLEIQCDENAVNMIERGHHFISAAAAKEFVKNNITHGNAKDGFRFPQNPSFQEMGVTKDDHQLALAVIQNTCSKGEEYVDKSKIPTSLQEIAQSLKFTNAEVIGVPKVIATLLRLNKDANIRCTQFVTEVLPSTKEVTGKGAQ